MYSTCSKNISQNFKAIKHPIFRTKVNGYQFNIQETLQISCILNIFTQPNNFENMNKVFFQFILALILPITTWAQEKTFEFSDELCLYNATYDSKLYTENQLADTYKLVQGYYSLYTNDKNLIDDIFASTVKEIKGLDLVKSSYFEVLRKSFLTYLEETYKIKKAEFAAKNGNKDALLKHYQQNPTVKYYSQALVNGGDELIKAYEHLTKEQMKQNAAPEVLWKEYLNNIASSDAQQRAFDQVLNYGWWNTVNHQLPHVNIDGTQFEAYKKLFIRIDTVDCEEP